ncbi:dockerin type I domain-containing protein [Lacipirellula sp.]|uniref:dockerin type I domain-containing protein n=1 Tax=Lacipirellula sp. TaxID=2691419 RepID=UPI003D12EA87
MNSKNSSLSIHLLALAAICCATSLPRSNAQTSVLNVGPGTVDWFNANAWSNGVPNAAGQYAEVRLAPDAVGGVTLGSAATLEELLLNGRGTLNFTGAGPLNFAHDGAGELLLRLTPSAGDLNVAIAAPLAWAPTELLRADVALQGTLNLNGAIGAAGGLVKTGAGTLRLAGANAAWAGDLEITGGVVIAGNAYALGAAAGVTTIRSGGRLVIEHSTVEPLKIDGGVVQIANKDLIGTIEISGSATIHRPRNPLINLPPREGGGQVEQTLGLTNIHRAISGNGDLTIDNQSRDALYLRGNSTYTGQTYLSAGTVYVTSSTALGATTAGTTLNGGTLNLGVATAEPMYVNGGTLNFTAASSTAGALTLRSGTVNLPSGVNYAQQITLDHATNALVSSSGRLSGGIVGTGSVTLRGTMQVDGAPIANEGDLIIANTSSQTTVLATPNSFTGKLVLLAGETVIENLQAASRPVQINGGTLSIKRSDLNLTTPIRINRGTIDNFGQVSSPIVLDQTTGVAALSGGRFTGVISGQGDVEFRGYYENDQTINGQSTFSGLASVTSGVVNANSSNAFGATDWGTVVRYGTLNVNASTNEKLFVGGNGSINLNASVPRLPKMLVNEFSNSGEPQLAVNVPSSFAGLSEAAQGRLLINANTSVEALKVRDQARVIVAAGKTLHVAGEIELQDGRLEGAFTGAPTIRKTTFAGASLADMPQFAGQIIVEQGVLQAYANGLGTAAGATRVARGAQLSVYGVPLIADDIYLEDAVGPQSRGGLYMAGDCCGGSTTMTGRLDLGPNGSIIGGGGNTRNGLLRIEGQVSGGSLTTWGSGVAVRMTNALNPYTGATDVRQGYVELSGNGRLAQTSAIVLHESEGTFDGTLLLDNQESALNIDRIAANIPVEFRGGSLSAFGGAAEAFGTLRFAEGHSYIESRSTALSANRIERQTGATLFVEINSPIAVTQTPDNVGGLLPWMTVRDGTTPWGGPYYELFGEVINGQIRAMNRSSIKSNLNTATTNDVVGVPATGRPVLAADREVKALLVERDGIVDLAGHTLTVASGGVSAWGGEIRNGNITAGSGRELILHNGVTLLANIVDGADGPLNVTIAGGRVGGANSFTGKLTVNENTTTFQSENSLPSDIDVDVVGGNLELAYASTGVKQLGKLRVAGGGSFVANGQFEFEQIDLEYGDVQSSKLVGDFPIRKSTIGTASIKLPVPADPSYTGTVAVDDGILTIAGLPAAKFQVNGGRLRIEQDAVAANPIQLNGGELEFFKLSGPISITAPSTLITMRIFTNPTPSLAGPLSGDSDLSFHSDIQYFDSGDFSRDATLGISRDNPDFTGDVHIYEAAISAYRPQALGSGDVNVHSGGTLNLSYDSVGSGVAFANQVILDGGTLRGSSQSRLTGALRVTKASYIGGLNLTGPVYLGAAPLTTAGNETTRFLGQLHVGADSELVLGRRQGTARGLVELGGTILAAETNSVLNVARGGLDELLFTASLHVDAGRSLQLRLDDAPMTVTLGTGQSISGNGFLRNDFVVADGGAVAPGASALTVDGDLTFGGGGRFNVEIASGQLHDQLIVTGNAALTGGQLNVSLLGDFLPQLNDEFVILQADSLSGMFANAAALNTIADGWRVDWMLNAAAGDLVLQVAAVEMQGDFNGNGVVDGADLAVWKTGYGTSGVASHAQGDASGDGRVDGADFLVWQRQNGSVGAPPAAANVPEPASGLLLAAGLSVAISRRRASKA